ncbi:Ig-like domain-containing protein [Desulfitobacterium hafniense]|uniref:BIG2 domain-containing protein n=2 Tax=Desulfitobacterium hafniense TaxID=49338 RepID=Q24UU6_DESHY|nr:Ig-like domain-containing protein [Desulfitobacterium hafniense]KTE89764.1 hypothetical protein AT727_10470 [Desulfitobacterium hafniense]BAE84196.1 hypothetical protein DSY2407 [Desulfitobacterium hafniense Y51]
MHRYLNPVRIVVLIIVSSLILSGCYKPYDPDDDYCDPTPSRTFIIDDEPYKKKSEYVISDKEVNKSYTAYVTIVNNGENKKEDTAKDVKLFLVDETRKIIIEVGTKDIQSSGYTTFPKLSYSEHARVHLVVEGYIKKNKNQYDYVKVKSNSFNIGNPTSSIESLSVTPMSKTIKVGESVTYKATAKYKDCLPTVDVTNQVNWYSTDPSKATMNGNKAAGVGVGTTKIIASFQDKTVEATLIVTAPDSFDQIYITPTIAEVLVGQGKPFYAYGKYGHNQEVNITNEVTWSSSNSSTATIESNGVATGKAAGTTTITATFKGKSASASLTVKAPPSSIPGDERLIWEKEIVE